MNIPIISVNYAMLPFLALKSMSFDFVGHARYHDLEAKQFRSTKNLGLIEVELMGEIKAQTLSFIKNALSQREQLAVNSEDIYFSEFHISYAQVGVIFDEEEGKSQKRFVEITMVYHSLKGLSFMRDRGEEPPVNTGMLPFIREITKGMDLDWTVNLLNHFKPIDDVTN
ncbi:hypothetical protein NQ317_008442 [Molorchus minor]|uniref:Uncharacterized protein n=1 Tax=Molorchus minor TaxID=1323400 RepID=A0ABQ9JEU8_9CUCU|nr:hypothetical protein NQ317_008442 [Molorchus minor]